LNKSKDANSFKQMLRAITQKVKMKHSRTIKRHHKQRQDKSEERLREIYDDTVWAGVPKPRPREICILKAGVPADWSCLYASRSRKDSPLILGALINRCSQIDAFIASDISLTTYLVKLNKRTERIEENSITISSITILIHYQDITYDFMFFMQNAMKIIA